MGKGSSGTKTTYTSSPEQQQMYSALMPMINAMAGQGTAQMGMPNYGAPMAPTSPSMTGVLSGIPQYQIPNVNSMMPSQDWWNSLSPDVMQGVWAPYQQASKGMLEQLGGMGQLGSARGGATGAAGAAMGQFNADAANKVGLQAWQMSQPAMQAGWQAQLAQNQQGYGNQLTEAGTNYQNQLAQQQRDYQTAMQAWQMPFGLTQQLPGTYSQGVTTQPQNPMAGPASFLGGAGGGIGGFMLGGPVGGLLGYGIGSGLGGLFG